MDTPSALPAPPVTPAEQRFRPSVTVAAIIEDQGRFLLVEEQTPEGLRLNNPAGHLECGETPLQAVVRETLEETGRAFRPEALLGVYLARFLREASGEDITYLRFAYVGHVGQALPGHSLDTGIVRSLWLSAEEVQASQDRHRSPLVWQCIQDHLAGKRLPLDAVSVPLDLAQPWRAR